MLTLLILFSLTVGDAPNGVDSPQEWRQEEAKFRQAFGQANKNFKPRHFDHEEFEDEVQATESAGNDRLMSVPHSRFGVVRIARGYQVVWATPGQITPVGEPWDSRQAAEIFARQEARRQPHQLQPKPAGVLRHHHTANTKQKQKTPVAPIPLSTRAAAPTSR